MARLVIDDVDEELLARLKDRAAARSQSVAEIAKEIIVRAIPSRGTASDAFRKIRALTPPGPQADSTDIIRQIRDE
ncbi:hypothetical protein [Bosea sp. (in: a-proteobacteria)]|jgi:plasmid stability protein|uniref:hypothetical protein n=1 Tax=Bosea sp. (in: a-proteobacteria) TaxID=1871050 RepID=UPI0027354C67|nr:hypothetical protein [Bosea sp. (in: a-proteobacteria)]MDP3411172.1 hypothetical protein [Bosea sp. (in: a-proteobacteria)]